MQQQSHATAQRLLNLYRQEHVIIGGWATVNPIFVDESTDDEVIRELENLPTGKKLIKHINNLRSGRTPMDSIEPDLLPYGGLMTPQEPDVKVSESEINNIKSAIQNFEPTLDGLNKLKQMPFITKYGNDWIDTIKSLLAGDADASERWEIVAKTARAYQIWDWAKELTSETLTERNRAQIQADMPEFETYLPMFGDAGNEMLTKLRTFISSMPS